MYQKYKALAQQETNVLFAGRLGSYWYCSMDQAIAAALELAGKELG